GLDARYPYVYDLGEIWMQHTGLPFVFAVWVSNQPLDATFLSQFNQALEQGIAAIPELTFLIPAQSGFDLETYFTKHISYRLDDEKRRALSLFLSKISPKLQLIMAE
ncbi:MAG: MqnA/MqnD/SBP family protein, partial [Saprospiraceae bacterium]|nr:MqnA/MqnD/SBP family protein [Saprospiraceae bacterium]